MRLPSCTTFHEDCNRQPVFSSVVLLELATARVETAKRKHTQRLDNTLRREFRIY